MAAARWSLDFFDRETLVTRRTGNDGIRRNHPAGLGSVQELFECQQALADQPRGFPDQIFATIDLAATGIERGQHSTFGTSCRGHGLEQRYRRNRLAQDFAQGLDGPLGRRADR